MTFFDCTADLVGQLNGMDRKECYRLTHPLSKISGYATAQGLWFSDADQISSVQFVRCKYSHWKACVQNSQLELS